MSPLSVTTLTICAFAIINTIDWVVEWIDALTFSNTIDRVVEDLIQESMQRGDFDNLAGFGKPIDYKQRSPMLDATTYKINQLLKDEGFAPDWIMLEKDIRWD